MCIFFLSQTLSLFLVPSASLPMPCIFALYVCSRDMPSPPACRPTCPTTIEFYFIWSFLMIILCCCSHLLSIFFLKKRNSASQLGNHCATVLAMHGKSFCKSVGIAAHMQRCCYFIACQSLQTALWQDTTASTKKKKPFSLREDRFKHVWERKREKESVCALHVDVHQFCSA